MALPPSSKYLQRPNDPVDEVERDSITKRLNEAFADGRITHDEYAESMELLYAARRLGDLVPVAERLPAPTAPVPAIVEQGGTLAGQVSQGRDMRLAGVAVLAVGVILVIVLIVLLVILL